MLFFTERKEIAKCRFQKCRLNTMRLPSNEQSSAMPVENDMTNEQALTRAKDDVTQELRNAENCKQEKHARSCIYDWVDVISKLYDSGWESRAKQTIALPCGKNFWLNRIQMKLKGVAACSWFVIETGYLSLRMKRFLNLMLSTERTNATTVWNVYIRNMLEVLKN